MGQKFMERLLQWIYPPRCPVCGEIVPHWLGEKEGVYVCCDCQDVFCRVKTPVCFRCGRPVAETEEFCENCRKKQFLYSRGFPIWIYDSAVKASIAAFKYHDRREYARYYGQEFARAYGEMWRQLPIQALVPVPLHPRRQKKRGYNQAVLFAREIGKRLHLPVCEGYLLRVKNTLPQKELDDRQRRANLHGAFIIDERKKDSYTWLQCIALVDDIYTTGSTIEACTEVLMGAGVRRVYFASISIVAGEK